MTYPVWVKKQKRPGTNITCSKGKYYLYEVSSVWDKEKKRARKITVKYLGRITDEGLLPPKRDTKKQTNITVKEYGAINTLMEIGDDIYTKLKEIYSFDGLMEKQYTFGTLALCTNLDDKSEEIYILYKSRAEIEQSFDF